MKNRRIKLIGSISFTLILLSLVWSCQDESAKMNSEQVKSQTALSAKDNAEIIAATQDVIELNAGVFDDEGLSSGRASTSGRIEGDHHPHGNKYGCEPNISGSYSLDNSHKDSLIYTGSLTIDFGDGSTCTDSTHIRKGKMTNAFIFILSFKDSITYSTTQALTFVGFEKDSVILDGVFTTKRSTGNPVTVEAKDARITYPDGTSASWNGVLTYTYAHGRLCEWKDNTVTVTGSISGTNRQGVAFTATITNPVVYKYACDSKHYFVPVSGTIEVSIGGIVSTLDFGDGTCNKVYTITLNGTVTEYEFEHHHH